MSATHKRDLSVIIVDDLATALSKVTGENIEESLLRIKAATDTRLIDVLEGHEYRMKERKKGISLRYCPLCGGKIESYNTWRVLGCCEMCNDMATRQLEEMDNER